MKTLKSFCLLLAMFVVPIVRAGAPPETINLHQRDGNIITAAFTEFNRIEFSGDNLQFVGRNEPVRVKLGTIRKITFGEPHEAFGIPVIFAATGNGTGTLTAFVLETDQSLLSGEEAEAGNTVVFRAEPAQGSKIRGWYINEVYKETAATEERVVLDKELHAEGLYVEVEFVKEEEPGQEIFIPVSFAATGNGTGTLTAFVLATDQSLLSGGEVEAGNTVVFRAEPAQGSKIRGWYINEEYKETAATEQRVVLDKELHADGLYVEVEFVKETGIESGERNLLNVYVQGREIHIESTCELKRAELLDMGGRLLRTQNSAQGAHQMLLHAGNVASGVYILKVRSTEREETRKVIIR